MSAAQLTKAMEKASIESSKITQMMIDAGRGYEYPNEMMKKSDPLSLKYQKSASLLQDLYAEKNRRMTYQGNMRPIKYQGNPTMATKKFSPAQIAAQKLFAERARAGTLGKGKRKANPAKKYRFNVTSKTSPRYVAGFFSTKQAAEDYRSSLNSPFNFTITKKEIDSDVVVRKTKATIERDIYGVPSVKRKPNPEKVMQQYTVFHRGTSNIAGTVREASPKAAKEKIANRLGLPTLTYLVARKTNPDKDEPNKYVKRASQITGKAPSSRLLKRRTKALFAPEGYFPNPKAAMMTGYQVICMHPKKHVVGIFKTMAEAKMVARAMADAKGVAYGVKAVKVHKAHFAV